MTAPTITSAPVLNRGLNGQALQLNPVKKTIIRAYFRLWKRYFAANEIQILCGLLYLKPAKVAKEND